MTWSLKFDEPIELANGKRLRTLRDAGEYVIALPQREAEEEHWQTAMACLLSASEKKGPVMMARLAMMQALQAGQPIVVPTRWKRLAKKHRIIS